MPDLPAGAARGLERLAADCGLAISFLVAPNTPPARVDAAVVASTGFVYVVPLFGVTGARESVAAGARELIAAVRERAAGRAPVAAGFGLRTAAQVAELAPVADGLIVGSALVAAMRDGGAARARHAGADPVRGDAARVGSRRSGTRRARIRRMCFDNDSRPPLPPIRGGALDARELTLTSRDGTAVPAYAARAESPTGAGMVILPDVRGLHAVLRGAHPALRRGRGPRRGDRLLRPNDRFAAARRGLRVRAARHAAHHAGRHGRRGRRGRATSARPRAARRIGSTRPASASAGASASSRPPPATT